MCPTTPQLVRPAKILSGMERAFQLYGDLVIGSYVGALAYLREWNPSANAGNGGYVLNTDIRFYVRDIRALGYFGVAGTWGQARSVWSDNGWQWEIIDMPRQVIWNFELTAYQDLAPGGTAYANPLNADGTPYTDVTFDIEDVYGMFRGRKRDKFASPHNKGSRGYALMNASLDSGEILYMQPVALTLRGVTYAAVTGGAITLTSHHVMEPVGGIIWDQDPAGDITCDNTFSSEIDEGGIVVANWDEATVDWQGYPTECPA